MSSTKKKKRTHKIRAVNPGQPPEQPATTTSTPNTGSPQSKIRQLKSRLLK